MDRDTRAEAVFDSAEPTPEEVAEAIRSLEVNDLDRYSVKWAAEDREHSTRYDVTHVSYRRNQPPTMQIIGGRGGKYRIDPNVANAAPMIRYLSPNGSEQEFFLRSLTIFDQDFAWNADS
jgi:hypothetical protein